MGAEVVIVGADGAEHVFPAGFDPKRAAGIVKQRSAPPPNAPDGAVSASEPDTWLGGFAKGLKEQFSPRRIAHRASEGAIGVTQGATALINPQTYLDVAKAAPGIARGAMALPGRIAEEGIGPTLDRAKEMAFDIANDPRSVGQIAGGFAAPGVGGVVGGGALRTAATVAPKVPGAMQVAGSAIEQGARAVARSAPGRFGLGGAVASMNPGAIAIAAAPYAVQAAGKGIQAAGRGIGRLITKGKKAADVDTGDTVRMPAPIDTGDTIRMAPPVDTGATVRMPVGLLGPAPKSVEFPKPKLSAAQVAAELRKKYGSEKAGRMLFGKKSPGVNPASASDRQAAIKRLAPGESKLPDAAAEAIAQQMAGMSPEEAFKYAMRAPNSPAQQHIGQQLRAALIERMTRGATQ